MSPRTSAVVFSFRPGIKDFLVAVKKSNALKTIFVAPSYMKTVSKSAGDMLKELGIELKSTPTNVWGHRSDVDNFVELEVGDGNNETG